MIVVAENLTVTVPEISAALAGKDPGPIHSVAKIAATAKVPYLDVNLGPRSRRSKDDLLFVLETLRGCWEGGIWVDTTDCGLMEVAALNWEGDIVLNGYAAGGGREEVLELAASRELDLVVFLMDNVPPSTLEERLALCAELVGKCNAAGLPTEKLIIDPLVVPMGWMDGQARNADLFTLLKTLPDLFGDDIRSVVGLSNLLTGSTGQKPVRWLEEAFLAMAAGAGLTHVMMDVKNEKLLKTARAIAMMKGDFPFAPGELS